MYPTVLKNLLCAHFLGVEDHHFAGGCPEGNGLPPFDKNARQWYVAFFRCWKPVRPEVLDGRAVDRVCVKPIIEVVNYEHVFPLIV